MTTIEVNECTKAGKALLEAARVMAEKNIGIVISPDANDRNLVRKMKRNLKGELLSSAEKNNFISSLKKTAGQ